MRRNALPLAAVCGAAIAIACGGSTTTTNIVGPEAERCQTIVSTPPSSVPSSGSRITLTITVGRDCTWTAAPEAGWLTVAPGSGQGDAALNVVAGPNDSRTARSGSVVVGTTRVTIRQDAAPPPPPPPPTSDPSPSPSPNPSPNPPPSPAPTPPPPAPPPGCTFALAPDLQAFDANGGDGSARLSTQSGCEWTASSSDGWIEVRNPRSGRGDADLQYRVERNTGQARNGTISAGGRTLRVEQAAAAAPPPTPSCTYELSPDRREVRADGGGEHFNVRTSSGCGWSASNSVGWITLERSSGSGDGRVEYRVQENTSQQERTGRISVAGRTHEVVQRGARR